MILDDSSSTWTATEVEPLVQTSEPVPVPPAPSVGSVEDGIPTGNLIIENPPESEPRRLAVQTAIIIGSALLVGLLVFVIVRSVVSADQSEDATPGPVDDVAIIEPGPGGEDAVASEDSSRSGARRDSEDDGLDESAPFAADVVDDDQTDSPAAPAAVAAASGDAEGDRDDASEQPDPSSNRSTGQLEASTATVTTVIGATTDVVSPSSTSSPSPGPGAAPSSTTRTSTTAPSTTAVSTPTTAASSTVTTVGTTTSPAPTVPAQLIALPTDGSRRLWDTFTRFRAAEVPGATRYCWTFNSNGRQREECSPTTIYDLPASPGRVPPGPVTVDAVAYGAGDAELAKGRISISLLVGDVLRDPDNGERFDDDEDVRFRSHRVPTADNYCWTLTQGSVSTGEICDSDGRRRLRSRDLRSDGFGAGPASLHATAFRGSTLVADQTISITFE